jgi:CheY-like chemotaxis protein
MVGDEKQIKAEPVKTTTGIPEEIRGLKVLVADDEEYNRLLFKKIFDTWKARCSLAENGMEALELLKEEKFDIVFMDLLMPGIDGIKTTRFIRDEMKISSREMPVILISAAPVKEDWHMYLKAGVNSYLTKPFTEQTLLAVIMETWQNGNNVETESASSAEEKKPETVEKINLSNLNHISGGDQQFVRQMLESFITTTSRGLSAIREEIEGKNWDAAADQSHRIQPPCRHIGAMELYAILRNLEKSLRQRQNTDAAGLTAENAWQEFEEIKTLINEYITNLA